MFWSDLRLLRSGRDCTRSGTDTSLVVSDVGVSSTWSYNVGQHAQPASAFIRTSFTSSVISSILLMATPGSWLDETGIRSTAHPPRQLSSSARTARRSRGVGHVLMHVAAASTGAPPGGVGRGWRS